MAPNSKSDLKSKTIWSLVAVGIAAGLAAINIISTLHDPDKQGQSQDEKELLGDFVQARLPDTTIAAMSDKAVRAMQKGDFSRAVKIVVALAQVDGNSPEQHILVKNAVQNLKIALAQAASDGDTNAVEAIQYFRNNSAAGR